MPVEVVSIVVLCAIFLVATVFPVHMGALSLAAAFAVGMAVLDGDFDAKVDRIADGFPGDLFVVLAGVTFLFAIAKNNGTVDWLIQAIVRSVRGRVALIPWILFLVTAALVAVGGGPGTIAMIAPIGMGFAVRYGIDPLLVGLMIVNGCSAGMFSPIGIPGAITNGVVERYGLVGSPLALFLSCFFFNLLLAAICFALFGARRAAAPTTSTENGGDAARMLAVPLTWRRALTVAGLAALAAGALLFGLHVGFAAFALAVLLSAVDPAGAKGAINQIAWPTVLLVCGIVTYVSLMEELGTMSYLGGEIAAIGAALAAALAICCIGAVVSAFASTTGILGALIPLTVPLLEQQNVSSVGLVAALAISASVVDSSPFSTNGALIVASAPEADRDAVFRRLFRWAFTMVALAPLATWLVFVVPGWL